ncbi:MAG: DUF6428 family protein [Akkermansiaceae bacterium]
MKLSEFLDLLQDHPNHHLTLSLPDGSTAPAHFHITEVGHLTRSFLDCGGKQHRIETCLLQVWVAHDYNHRIQAGKLAKIVSKAAELIPSHDLEVEFEHEAPVLTQLPVVSYEVKSEALVFHLRYKATDCLAKDLCLPEADFSLPGLSTTTPSFQLFKQLNS